MSTKKTKNKSPAKIAMNKKARFDYFIEDQFEAGIMLEGWEVKSLRAGKLNITESYVIMKNAEAWLLGAHIIPLQSASTHVNADPTRTRKLLLHRQQIEKIQGAVAKHGRTCVALSVYWSKGIAKCEIALASGKQKHDKRESQKEKDWNRDKARVLRQSNKD
jgi:SsrA-binding protein